MKKDEIERVTIKRIDTSTNEDREFTISDEEECEEIAAIMSVIVLANFRRKLFRAVFIALCIVTALMLIAYIARYEMLLSFIIAVGILNLLTLQRCCFWSRCGIRAMQRCEEFFERQIAREATDKLAG